MITVRYSCPECGLSDRQLQVPAREIQEVVEWFNQVIAFVGDDHRRVSPGCRAKSLKDLKIPAPAEAEFLGQQVE